MLDGGQKYFQLLGFGGDRAGTEVGVAGDRSGGGSMRLVDRAEYSPSQV